MMSFVSGMERDVTSSKDNPMTLTFRCPAELEGLLPPPPVPAALGLPDWFKAMPPQAFNAVNSSIGDTVKRSPPFIDAMTYGFLLPLICDLKGRERRVHLGQRSAAARRSQLCALAIGFHDASQVTATPLFEQDRFVVKFHNLWTIEAPDGYALLFTHPAKSFRPALHDTHRFGRLRPLSRQLDSFSGTLARRKLQWRAAEGHAGRAMHAGQARELGDAHHDIHQRRDATRPRPHKRNLPRDRGLSAAVPSLTPQVFQPAGISRLRSPAGKTVHARRWRAK
jgi:hypothetical protein